MTTSDSCVGAPQISNQAHCSQVDSFIPLWAWDLPVKKGKGGHRKKDKKEGKSSKAGSGAGTPLAGEDVPRIQELAEGEE